MRDDSTPEQPIPKGQFADDLRALYREEIEVPDWVDDRVLASAQRELRRRRRPWILRQPLALGSVAALLILGVLGVWASFQFGSDGRAPEPGALLTELADAVPGARLRTKDTPMQASVRAVPAPTADQAPVRPEDLPEDIDANGRVDIVDALVLARRVVDREPLPTRWDFNRDGRVDRSDADVVAILAVRLQ